MKILVAMDLFEGKEYLFDDIKEEFIYRYHKSVSEDDVKDCDVILGNINLDLLDKAEKLKYIHLDSAGSDTVNDKLCGRNVLISNSTGCFSLSISETLIGMILYFYRNFNKYIKNQQEHLFKRESRSYSIYGSKVLVIGCGSIGMTFAEKMSLLGAEITGIKATPGIKPPFLKDLYTSEKIDNCLKEADIIALCLPQNDNTRQIIDKRRLSLLKDGALIMNVGRGSAIDQNALIEELKTGRIKAGLDVFEKEPLESDSPLWEMENCLINPHAAGTNSLEHTRNLLIEMACNKLKSYLNNQEIKNVVDPLTGYRKSK